MQTTSLPSTVRGRGDLPAIGRSVETTGMNEKLISQTTAQKPEPMLIDDIQFWDEGGTEPASGVGSRKPSVAALELAQIAADAEEGQNVANSNDQRGPRPSHIRSKASGISKQEMCH